MTTTAPAPYRSGLCAAGRHDRCRGDYGTAVCDCPHHTDPEPEPPRGLRIGSLFSGYGGLEQGVQSVLGGTVAWHSDIDPGACKILAHRYPAVPNLGDITTVDWADVEPVDVLVGGFPCQDVSSAGLRKGLRPDTRSGLWCQFAYAINQLRPPLVVIENVRGLLYAEAHCDVEPCPWCVGGGDVVLLRALGAVLGDLADIGYDASWQGLQASDVGAPHGRFRVFIVAWPARGASDTDSPAGGRDEPRRLEPGPPEGVVREAGRRARRGGDPARSGNATCDELGHAWLGPRCAWCGAWRDVVADPGCDAWPEDDQDEHSAARHRRSVADPVCDRRERRTEAAASGRADGGRSRPGTLRADERLHPDRCGADAAAHPDAGRRGPDDGGLRAGQPDTRWGVYGPAIHRWERVLGRVAPSPTEPGRSGMARIREFADREHIDGYTARAMLRAGKWGARLSPLFVEFLMGLLLGWVTDVPGLSRNEQLKALGNGVVPQQCAAALRLLLPAVSEAVA